MQEKVTATFAFASLATLIHEKMLQGETATPWDSDRLTGRRTTWNLKGLCHHIILRYFDHRQTDL